MPPTVDINGHDQLVDLVRTEFRTKPVRELLNLSPKALLGVTDGATAALTLLEIGTVFDLATSAVFDAAAKLVGAGTDLKSALYQHGSPTADLVREADAAGKAVSELQFLPVHVLQAIPDAAVVPVRDGLDAQTVRDLALYPPYRAALRLLTAAYFPENTVGYDPEQPPDLLPKSGEYPTERVQYSTLLLDTIPLNENEQLVDVTGLGFKPIDLQVLARADAGFKRTAFGALLTFNQSWFAQGVTLGQLLHGTSLAPGESTRIAVVDWSRRSRAGETEIINETDDLTNDQSRNRSISEVTKAVANEAQGGFSESNVNSHSTQSGTSSAAEISAPLGGLFGGPSGSVGHTSSEASSQSNADSYSTSWGHRNIASAMNQQINDRTHQHAHSNRSRRASVVKEVSQSEHEGVSTRVLANYNHMHALTIQYYEVVQVYRVEVSVVKADRVVFIPVALADLTNDAIIRRFQGVLTRAALSYGIAEALRNLDVLEIAPETESHFSLLGSSLAAFTSDVLRTRTTLAALSVGRMAAGKDTDKTTKGEALEAGAATALAAGSVKPSAAMSVLQVMNDQLWTPAQTSRLSGLLNLNVLRPLTNSLYLPTDVLVEGGAVESAGADVKIVFRDLNGAKITTVGPDSPVPMSQVGRIAVTGSSTERDIDATVTLTLNRNGVRFPVELPTIRIRKGKAGQTPVVQVKPGGVNVNLKQHLMDNRMHYSQAIYRSLDATQIALLLSGYGIEVGDQMVPVAQVVDPRPVRYIGNYLAFRMNSDPANDETWAEWLKDRGITIGAAKEDIVPLATGGTFAEAVLGRSNCAEKLDITRFWNWQDSPIPIQPSDIAAIQTGSRATPEDVKPGQLSNPIINITAPTSLPDPMGTAAVLAAIQNGNMFRDMSGLQATIGLAQAALQATSAGAATAGQQAGENMNNLLKANTERQRIAAEMVTDLARTAASAYTGGALGGGGGHGGGGSHSQDGAKINYFDRTQGQGAAGGSGPGSGGSATPVQGGGHSGGGNGSAAGGNGSGPGSGGYSQNPAALAATWGDSQSPSGLVEKLVDKVGGALGGDGDASSPLTFRKAWPKLDENTVLTRIKALAGNANLFNQAGIGLCTAAAFYHHAIQRKPAEFKLFADALYGGGIGFLGDLKVAPGWDLRNADYGKLLAKHDMPPQADWMLMSALRDSENWFFDYEGAPDESVAIYSSAKEMKDWYIKTGFYTSVTFDDDTSPAKIKAISKTNNNHIVLWIKTALLQSSKGKHVIPLEGPITVDEANDKVSFQYWSWASDPVKTFTGSWTALKANYLGVVTATF
ncbi:MAG TPA: hypothetical protein VLJ59_03800 [Mycobacteriales bacterium]|nr:hypothetical protein [Mycobacteriales bacterium]